MSGWANRFSGRLGQDYSPSFSIQQANTTTGVSLNRVFLGSDDLAPRLVLQGDPNDVSRDLAHQFDVTRFSLPPVYPAADGTGERNYLRGRGSFSNDLTLVKSIPIAERKAFEIRASAFNVFNRVRQPSIVNGIQYKARGRTLADGVTILNTPEANASRVSTGNPTAIYNAYRTGVGHVNITDPDPMRVIEIGLKFRF